MLRADLASAKVLIIGGGVTGTSVADVLEHMGSQVSIFDENSALFADARFVSHDEVIAGEWKICVVSPGWKIDHPVIEALRSRGIALISEVDLAWRLKEELRPDQTWLAITGTNGKTTTVEMTATMLNEGGVSALACGNVGNTVIGAVAGGEDFAVLVLELSSFQLQWSELPEFAAAAILNIADDHTDWHGGFSNYVRAKMRILDRAAIAVLNADDPKVVEATAKWPGRKISYSLRAPKPGELGVVEELLVDRAFVENVNEAEFIAELSDIQPQVPHAVANALAATALARSMGVDYAAIRRVIQSFRPGRHRIELVAELNGVRWINDSKATNPHAAAASLNAFDSIIWIAGGLAKGASMAELVAQTNKHIKGAVLIGQDRDLIARELAQSAPHVTVIKVDPEEQNSLMEDVVAAAATLATSGDTVLLAPACASMDQFVSYADRGDQFTQAVMKLVKV